MVGAEILDPGLVKHMTSLENADWVIAEEERLRQQARDEADLALWAAFMLAPIWAVADALLRGEAVPESALDQECLKKLRKLGLA